MACFIAKLSPSGSTLLSSSYIGGSDADQVEFIAVDDDGHAYASGLTRSADFPTRNAFQPTYGGGTSDAFVAKVRACGELEYSTFLGGSGQEGFTGIAVDASGGEALAVGRTDSLDFPTAVPLQPANAGGFDVFVTKLARNGRSLIYSTYLGGTGRDEARSNIVTPDRQAYVVGVTTSTNFPTHQAFQSSNAGGMWDSFVFKLPADGSRLLFSTYFGGSGDDRILGVTLDRSGHVVFSGLTNSTNLPMVNPLQRTFRGGMFDAVVGQIARHGEALLFSTYFGGSGEERGLDVDVDAADNVYVMGLTDSADFPTLNAFQPRTAGSFDAWLAKITP